MFEQSLIDPQLPLCDLHRHLDGSLRLQTILELAAQHNISLPGRDLESLRPHVQIMNPAEGLMEFIAKFQYLTAVLVDADACRRVAFENVLDAAAEGIDYIELRFSPWFMAETHGLNADDVTAAVIEGIRAGETAGGVRAQAIGILSRTYGPEICMQELDALLTQRDGLVALDLAGDEKRYPASLFKRHFRRSREAGLRTTIHAGEADGPHSVWSAIRDLGAERIGHGIRSIEDPALVEYLAAQQIGLEVCLSSNLHTSTVTSLASHPARALLQAGVLLNLNTDDPGISGIDLPQEYNIAAPAAGLDATMIRQTQKAGLEMAFISAAEKQALRDKKHNHFDKES
ncbi:MAG: adenosine deaminase [Xanthomonadales bacterium]|nr:adenosine deaminase [Xanthomonadales bacterium]